MSWLYQGNEYIDFGEYFGFVYIITNLISGKRYIGKKQFFIKKPKYVKGKRKIYLIESDWQTYWSSSEELKENVIALGEHCFQREILRFCKSKSECSYFELKYQMEYDVLLNQDLWYNKWISCKINAKTLKNIKV